MFGKKLFWVPLLLTMNIAAVLIGLTYVLSSHPERAAPVQAEAPLIYECPGRDVSELTQRANAAEISLVFHYVSWSSEAKVARLAFDQLAEDYKGEAFFAAVDCWHLQCNCSSTIQTPIGTGLPHKWPTLIVRYAAGRVQLQYHGQWKRSAMSRFVENLLRPIERVHNKQDVAELHGSSEAVVLGLCSNVHSRVFGRFLFVAIKMLEYDPERSFKFAVAFGQTALTHYNLTAEELPQVLLLDDGGNVTNIANTASWKASDIIMLLHRRLKTIPRYAYGYRSAVQAALNAGKTAILAIGLNEDITSDRFRLVFGSQLGIEVPKLMPIFQRCPVRAANPSKKQCLAVQYFSRDMWQNFYEYNEQLNHLHSRNIYQQIAKVDRSERSWLSASDLKTRTAKFINQQSSRLWHQSTTQRANESLGVVLLETEEHKDLFESQQIPHNTKSIADVFIVDLMRESSYVLYESFSYESLVRFIEAFYAGNLQPIRRSQMVLPASNISSIANYNRQSLLSELRSENHTNIVLLYSPRCPLSMIMANAFTQLSLLFSGNETRFIRLDSQSNDLPWELTMQATPALIVFPKALHAESRVFPRDQKVTVANLMSFVLAQLPPPLQLRLTMEACERVQHRSSCLQFASNIVAQYMAQFMRADQLRNLSSNEYNLVIRTLLLGQQKPK